MLGAELHYFDDPLERWRFIRERSQSDGWLSTTNVGLRFRPGQ
jgi:hypothetical protein